MKKYAKPELFYESFTTADCIAACALKALVGDGVCGGAMMDENGNVIPGTQHFNLGMTGCADFQPQDGDPCYVTGADTFTIFNS